jgi:hypothetical protein
MFKKAFILLAVLILASSAFSIRLIDPLSKEITLTGENFVGTVSPGGTLELIFSKELTDKYESLDVVSVLPEGFKSDVRVERESIKLFISVPANAVVGDYPLSLKLSGTGRVDDFSVNFSVVAGSTNVSPASAAVQETIVGKSVEYKLFFVNNTDSEAAFDISTDLRADWEQADLGSKEKVTKRVVVPKRQNLEETLVVYPRMQGKKEFKVKVDYENTSSVFSYEVDAKPTINSKFAAVTEGFPFFSFSLLPSYFINGILAVVFK